MRSFKDGRIKANSIDFYFIEEGPMDGPLVLCLHGFPETCRTYRYLLPALAEAGYLAVAPNMRGVWPTGQPADRFYNKERYALDALALMQAFGYNEAMLVGHGWGADAAIAASQIAGEKLLLSGFNILPKTITKVAAVSGGYCLKPGYPGEQQDSDFIQQLADTASPETLRKNGFQFLKHIRAEWSKEWKCSHKERDSIISSFRKPGSLEAVIAYCRSQAENNLGFMNNRNHILKQAMLYYPVPAPALLVYGANDGS